MSKLIKMFLIISISANIMLLIVFDRTLEYRNTLSSLEERYANEGIQLKRNADILAAGLDRLIVFTGGSLFRYWVFPEHFPYHVVNRGSIEEKIDDTLKRLDDTVFAIGAKYVLINAGYCGIVTSVRMGTNSDAAIEKNFDKLIQIIETAKKNHVVPILTTLTPERPRHLLAYLKKIEYDSGIKKKENKALEKFNQKMRVYSRENGTPLFDFHKVLADENGELVKRYSVTDGEHLSLEGYNVLNAYLIRELDNLFENNG